ncbi:hypothetical protein POKO110462_09620 [Pontibacter korlensis]|uniref:Multidrug transporter n=1 Tax=Pontibacter korlensis TaxID=400092 RepID=A0A0E3ZFS2_9BACT|nr:hypothetical protein [Pontibacter korlensis]AKD03048.1 hypothetical protein PKOR_07835 [Pontibacter korlensis]
MKKTFLYLLLIPLGLFSCNDDDDGSTPEPEPIVSNELSGDISTDITLDPSVEYKLTGSLLVVEGGKLRIPAGTVIKAEKGFNKYILVEQGGQIFVNGTADKPVKITSAEANPNPGDWGGLIINGRAKISGPTGVVSTSTTEINPAVIYGGEDNNDNSGVLEYLILEYTGAKSSADIEHNGLTLNAVGSGTKIENIYIPNGSDDAIEFFGGSVNVKNLMVVDSDDDMFDVTQGWTGTLDNAYGVWKSGYTSTESDPRGAELDGNLDGNTPSDVNQSDFVFKNITIVNESTFEMQDAVKVRRGAKATITNLLVKGGTSTDLIDLTDGKGNGNATSTIEYKNEGVTVKGQEVKNPDNATINSNDAITGANTSAFSWTGYTF